MKTFNASLVVKAPKYIISLFNPQENNISFTQILCFTSKIILRFTHLLIGVLVFPLFAAAQDQNPSIEEQIEKQKVIIAKTGEDTTSVIAYEDLGKLFMRIDRDSAKYYFNQGLDLARRIKDIPGEAYIHANLGNVFAGAGDFENAFDEFEAALNIFIKENMYKGQARMYLNLANIYEIWGDYRSALDYDLRGLSICDSIDFAFLLPQYHNNMGNLYFKIQDFENALHYFELAEKSTARSGRTDMIPHVKLLLSGAAEKQGDRERAYALALEVVNLVDSIPYTVNLLPGAYRRLATLSLGDDDYNNALLYYEKMLASIQSAEIGYLGPNSIEIAYALVGIGKSHLKLENLVAAEQYFEEAYVYADSTGQLRRLSEASAGLAEVKERLGKVSEAFEYHKIYKESADSLANLDAVREMSELSVKREYEIKQRDQELESERQAASQKRKEIIYISVLAAVVLFLVIILLLYRLQANKAKQAQLAKENLKLNLDHKNQELASNVLYALKKNELLLDVSDKLKQLRLTSNAGQKSVIDEVIQGIYTNSKDIGWEEFELRFKEVHSDFYNRLTKKFPNLTSNELRLSAFLKLNMTTKDISAITFQSKHSIVMARSRLKKKLNVQNGSLSTFLHKI